MAWLGQLLDAGADPKACILVNGSRATLAEAVLDALADHADEAFAVQALTLLSKAGLDLNAPTEAAGPGATTPLLCWQAMAGNTQAVRVLLAAGAMIEAHDDQGDTALGCALWAGFDETVQLLLGQGAQVGACRHILKQSQNNGVLTQPDTLEAIHRVDAEQARQAMELATAGAPAQARTGRL